MHCGLGWSVALLTLLRLQIGYGTEEANFALELTYNYGISSYEKGNDLRCVYV